MSQRELTTELEAIAEQSYNQLEGEWHDWLEVARKYEHKVKAIDRLDIRHTILIELYRARQRDKQPLPLLRAYRIASLMVALYWRELMRKPSMVSLNSELDNGEATELIDTIADDRAIDLEAWLDAKEWLLGCPIRLVQIATKRVNGIPLTEIDRRYFNRQRQREWARYQKTLL